MMPFERLEAWRSSHEPALAIYRLTSGWPATEWFRMTAQLRRAAISIPSNIVEGNARRGTRELRRYLDISLGSFAGVTYLLMLARDLGLPLDDSVEQRRCQTGRQLWGLYHSVAHS